MLHSYSRFRYWHCTIRNGKYSICLKDIDISENLPYEQIALAGIDALASFIREIGLPTTLKELKAGMRPDSPDPTDKNILRKVADTAVITPGCARQMSREEIYDILVECIG